ncbi:hypothetical protein H7I77_25140 [Mycolicibacterium novocastrense]|nr:MULTISPECIES: hypothetical protein [Mycolicibacterium]MCV7026597.1 hypothetical protein [Mycolicibacterium novocastrense]MDX1887469.1 hypothetical protein [Mycolicibacterium sp. 120270]
MSGTTGDSDASTAGPPWEPADVDLPQRVTARWCADNLTTPTGNAVVRAHLEPRSEDRRYRAAWQVLWQMISFDPRWRRTTIEMLSADREQAQQALAGGLTGKSATRARTYIHGVDSALARIEREAAGPLAWASAYYADFPPRAREVIETLTLAVDEFRRGELSPAELDATLSGLDLNPATRDIPAQARQRAAHNRSLPPRRRRGAPG